MIKTIKKIFCKLAQPSNIKKIGENSFIKFPRKIRGQQKISIGKNTFIDSNSWIEAVTEYSNIKYNPEIYIGDDIHIGRHVVITSIEKIEINKNSLLSEFVYISDHEHDIKNSKTPLVKKNLKTKGKVIIGENCFIGFRAIILPGVILGDGCIVGAGSVVTKSFASNSIIAGVPAVLIGNTNDK
jgi:acetyltransferase-like isoleucine patch superfamily enzyme